MRLLLGPGQRQDVTRGHGLIEGLAPGAVIADGGCDAEHLHPAVRDAGAEGVIPARSNRTTRRSTDEALYKARNLIGGRVVSQFEIYKGRPGALPPMP